MDIKGALIDLGLNKNEASVYLALLELGITQSGPIIKMTKLHRMLVYNALEKLTDEGLVTVLHKNNIKLFQPADPAALLDRTKKINDIAQLLVPQLRQMQQVKPDIINVRTLIGREGLQTNLSDVAESAARQANRTMCIIGGAQDTEAYDAFGEWYPEYVAILKKYNVRKHLLSPSNASDNFRVKYLSEGNTELRTLTQGLTAPTYTRITEEMVTIEMYKPQIITIQINNKVIARGYLDAFQLLWKTAKHEPPRIK